MEIHAARIVAPSFQVAAEYFLEADWSEWCQSGESIEECERRILASLSYEGDGVYSVMAQ